MAFPMLVLLASGCGYPQLTQEEDAVIPSDYTYIIGPGDSVTIFVWGNPDISTTATVRPDGKITIPLAEDLLASGKTPSQLARVMEKQLAKYVRDPQVVIMVGGFQGVYTQQVRIVGQLSGGGAGGGGGMGAGGGGGGNIGMGGSARFSAKAFPYKKDMTLLDLMIQVGGLGPYSDGNRASIIRNINGEQQHFGIRIDDLIDNADLSANVKILPGDIVIIPESFF
ncbi:polysaccharide export protein [Candidatus Methylobacter favarea]|uniref:polysaccharide export protein n=1 Tax=Candidatus Methylobacter favarea TaxID=2707345 RepID=UPI001FECAA60|nr:polysaccharide export protein [Candidatus Methylobacter favarea]